jgi:uncharacterized membrane protein YgaE (UPF0421/DUF939 family)
MFSFIDPLYLTEAEKELKRIMNDELITYKQHKELVILSPKILKYVKETYATISYRYSGHTESFKEETNKFILQIKDLENKYEKSILARENDKINYQLMLQNKDLEIKVRNSELKSKDMEIRAIEAEKKLLKLK